MIQLNSTKTMTIQNINKKFNQNKSYKIKAIYAYKLKFLEIKNF